MNHRPSRGMQPSLKTCRKVVALGDLRSSLSVPVPNERTTSGLVLDAHSFGHSHSARSIGLLWRNPPSWKEPRDAIDAGCNNLHSISDVLEDVFESIYPGAAEVTRPLLRFSTISFLRPRLDSRFPDEWLMLDLFGAHVFVSFLMSARYLKGCRSTHRSLVL